MKKYDVIIYDIDGTLLNTLDMNMKTLQTIIYEETGELLDIQTVYQYAPYPGLTVMHMLKVADPIKTYDRWVQYVNSFPEPARLYDGIDYAIQQLNHHFIQAVVSAKTHAQYKIDTENIAIFKLFKTQVLYEDTKLHKPEPEPLLQCLKRLNIDPSKALYVGDAIQDYLAANAANIDFAYASWGSTSNKGIIEPKFIFNCPSDLLSLLKDH